MGEYTLLYMTNSAAPVLDDLPEDEACLMLNHHLPIVWLALFERANIKDIEIEEDEGPWPYLVSELRPAKERLQARRPLLRSEFPSLKDVWIDQFADYLSSVAQTHLHLDANQLGSMVTGEGKEWRLELSRMLDMFDTPIEITGAAPGHGSRDGRSSKASETPSFLSKLMKSFGRKDDASARIVEVPGPSPDTLRGRSLYALRFGGDGDARTANCWWYCGGGGTDRFIPDD